MRRSGVYFSLPWWVAIPYAVVYGAIWLAVAMLWTLSFLVLIVTGQYRR